MDSAKETAPYVLSHRRNLVPHVAFTRRSHNANIVRRTASCFQTLVRWAKIATTAMSGHFSTNARPTVLASVRSRPALDITKTLASSLGWNAALAIIVTTTMGHASRTPTKAAARNVTCAAETAAVFPTPTKLAKIAMMDKCSASMTHVKTTELALDTIVMKIVLGAVVTNVRV